jgi:pyruvate/2-oxoglutarate dehydrogenase complex dihydrolipoamide acyltransferase (E2) component
MKKMRLLFVVPVLTAGVGFAGGVFAAGGKGKEIVVTPAADVKFEPMDPNDKEMKGAAFAVVFGDVKKKGQPVGILLRVPAGGRAGAHSHTSDDYVVGITGMTHDFVPGGDEGKALGPGGHWFQPGKMVHDNHCEEKGGTCLSFVYLPKGFDIIPAKADAKAAPTAAPAPAAAPTPAAATGKPAAPAPAPAAAPAAKPAAAPIPAAPAAAPKK